MVEGPPRLSPDQIMVMKLFEIADRLGDMVPEGKLTSESLVVGNQALAIGGLKFSLTFINDGPNNVYIWQDSEETNQNREPWLDGEVPLQLNEQLELPYRAKTSGIVYLRCKSGESAAVRYWRLI